MRTATSGNEVVSHLDTMCELPLLSVPAEQTVRVGPEAHGTNKSTATMVASSCSEEIERYDSPAIKKRGASSGLIRSANHLQSRGSVSSLAAVKRFALSHVTCEFVQVCSCMTIKHSLTL